MLTENEPLKIPDANFNVDSKLAEYLGIWYLVTIE